MRCKILHESKERIRIHIMDYKKITFEEADIFEAYLSMIPGVTKAVVYERTLDAVIFYKGDRNIIKSKISSFDFKKCDKSIAPEVSIREVNRKYQEKLVGMIIRRTFNKIFIPFPIRKGFILLRSFKYLRHGARCLYRGKLKIEVLDAISIGASMGRGDFKTASSVMFLLKIGEFLEEWTRKKAINDLARSMSLNVDKVWKIKDDKEVLVPIKEVIKDDIILVHTGNVIPVDGKVLKGESSVNQASLTGESIAVRKGPDSSVYAGTVVEEGQCIIKVTKEAGSGRYDNIIKMIETSESLKSKTENEALALADKLVPYCLSGTVLTYALTRNITRAISILMVDFSCALKLSMPLSVLSAMRECGNYHITVKGGKYLEAIAKTDTVVFDKTGTLTYATPTVSQVIPFNNWEEEEVLKVGACLEEHYPHSMANAVVKEAAVRNIIHEENHTKVSYVVAHGIASEIDNKKVVIGSYHFVFEDENCKIPDGEEEKFENISDEFSHLYLACDGVLVGVICIKDPLRSEAKEVLESLKTLGVKKTVMMTGDNYKTASAVAREVGVDEFYAEVLPEDKANFIKNEKSKGKKVMMIGDGINDSPALSMADVGIAISDGAAIAREIADVTISADNLYELVTLKVIANKLQKRIDNNYRFVLGFNGSLIAMGAMGFLLPAYSALLHNLSTLAISLHSMTNLIKEENREQLLLN